MGWQIHSPENIAAPHKVGGEPDKQKPAANNNLSGQNAIQRYLLAVVDAYVPEHKANIIRQYAQGEISLKRVEDLTGIKL